MRYEERRAEPEFFKQRRDKRAMRLDRIVESEHDQFGRDFLGRSAKGSRSREYKRCGHQQAGDCLGRTRN